jgi:hypothetical protein
VNAFEAAEKSGREVDLQNELEALFESKNTSSVPGLTVIPAAFLRVTVMVQILKLALGSGTTLSVCLPRQVAENPNRLLNHVTHDLAVRLHLPHEIDTLSCKEIHRLNVPRCVPCWRQTAEPRQRHTNIAEGDLTDYWLVRPLLGTALLV